MNIKTVNPSGFNQDITLRKCFYNGHELLLLNCIMIVKIHICKNGVIIF